MGYNVQEVYQYGKVYDVKAFGSSKLFKAKVVGVLEKGSNYIAHWLGKVELDNACIIPISEDFAVNNFTYPDYDMFCSRMVIQTDEPEVIVDKIEEFESLNLTLISVDDLTSERMSRFVLAFVVRAIIGLIGCAVIIILILIKRKYFSHKQEHIAKQG